MRNESSTYCVTNIRSSVMSRKMKQKCSQLCIMSDTDSSLWQLNIIFFWICYALNVLKLHKFYRNFSWLLVPASIRKLSYVYVIRRCTKGISIVNIFLRQNKTPGNQTKLHIWFKPIIYLAKVFVLNLMFVQLFSSHNTKMICAIYLVLS